MSHPSHIAMKHRLFPIALLAWLAMMLLACGRKDAGTFSVDVTWGVPAPTGSCWIFVEVRQVHDDGPPTIIAAASPARYTPSRFPDAGTADDAGDSDSADAAVSLDLPDVPHGSHYVVVVQAKDGVDDEASLLYTGLSSEFSLKRGDRQNLEVVLSSVDLSVPGEPPGVVLASEANLHLDLESGMFADFLSQTTVHLSNTPFFEPAATVVSPLSDLISRPDGFLWAGWDLNANVCAGDCADGERSVYARWDNPALNEDEISAQAIVRVDTAPPALERLPDLPEYAHSDIVMELAFTEPVVIASLAVDCGGLGDAEITIPEEISDDDPTAVRELSVVCPVQTTSENRDYTIALSASDLAGRSTGEVVLGTVTVDTILPELAEPIRYDPAAASLGQEVRIEFTLTESAENMTVMLGPVDITGNCDAGGADGLHYDCRYTVTAGDEEAEHNIELSVMDRAGNWAGFHRIDAVRFDFTSPEVVDATVSPSIAMAGTAVDVEIAFTEPLSAITFDREGLSVDTVTEDPNDPRVYRATRRVSASDENGRRPFYISFEDEAGNVSENVLIGDVTIDTVAPSIIGDVAVDREIANTDDTFSFRFTASETLSELFVTVGLVGLEVSGDCVAEADGRTYTCTHTVPYGEREGSKDIVLEMTDLAGNQSRVQESDMIVYNYADPELVSWLVVPGFANADSRIIVSLAFSEAVGNVTLDWDGLPGGYNPAPDEDAISYTFDIAVDEATPNGTYTIALTSAEDAAGRTVSRRELGTVTVDTVAPQLVNDALTVDKTLLKDGDEVGIAFVLSEAVKTLTLRIGDKKIPGGFSENCTDTLACRYRHVVSAAEETEGSKNIFVEMVDAAGNITTALFEGMMVYDFTPPRVRLASVSPRSATDGEEIVLTVQLSEEIRSDTIPLEGSGLAFTDLRVTDSPETYLATYTVAGNDAQGVYPLQAAPVEDLAGNLSGALDVGEARISRVVFVRASAPAGGDGLTWETAYASLPEALLWVIPDNQIWVQRGEYHPDAPPVDEDPRQATIQLKRDVAIYGGFEGDETELEQRQLSEDTYSVLDGRLPFIEGEAVYAYHVVTAAQDAYLDGFVIQNGVADGPLPHEVGGGVLIEKETMTLANCVVRDNTAATSGGGLYGYMSSVALKNTVFHDNGSGLEGGAVYGTDSFVSMRRCRFEGNTADQDGGGLVIANSQNAVIHSCTFMDNQSTNGYGGAIKSRRSDLHLANCLFDGNQARYGGGLSDRSFSPVTIAHCTFFDNTADQAGNGAYFEDNIAGNIDIFNTILWSGKAGEDGVDCQVEANRVEGDVGIAFTDMPPCAAAPNVVCDVGCLSEDPLFEPPSGSGEISLRLTPDSPCIDAGSCDLLPPDYLDLDDDGDAEEPLPLDLDDAPRCRGAADLGAYEAP